MRRFRSILAPAAVLFCLLVTVCPVRGAIVGTGLQTFVLSNEGSNGLITQLINAGWDSYNVYDTLVQIQGHTNPSVAGIITPAFLSALAACPASSQIFTTTLSNYNSPGVSLAISTDCTVQTVSVQGAPYVGQPGTTTLAVNISGVGPATFIYSTTSSPLTSWTTVTLVDPTYSVFAIAFSQSAPATPLPSTAIFLAMGLCAAATYLLRKRIPGLGTKS